MLSFSPISQAFSTTWLCVLMPRIRLEAVTHSNCSASESFSRRQNKLLGPDKDTIVLMGVMRSYSWYWKVSSANASSGTSIFTKSPFLVITNKYPSLTPINLILSLSSLTLHSGKLMVRKGCSLKNKASTSTKCTQHPSPMMTISPSTLRHSIWWGNLANYSPSPFWLNASMLRAPETCPVMVMSSLPDLMPKELR